MTRLLFPTTFVVAALVSAHDVTAAPAFAGRDTIPPALSTFSAEHAALLGGFSDMMRRAVAPAASRADRELLVRYLRSAVLPHAQNEELVLYPALDSVLGTRGYATATMVLDHRTIARLTIELSGLAEGEPQVFRDKALIVQALVESHFAKEEDFVLPNLARKMGDRELRALLARMESENVSH